MLAPKSAPCSQYNPSTFDITSHLHERGARTILAPIVCVRCQSSALRLRRVEPAPRRQVDGVAQSVEARRYHADDLAVAVHDGAARTA